MTKRELIRLAGISVTTVRNMEKGNNVNRKRQVSGRMY